MPADSALGGFGRLWEALGCFGLTPRPRVEPRRGFKPLEPLEKTISGHSQSEVLGLAGVVITGRSLHASATD